MKQRYDHTEIPCHHEVGHRDTQAFVCVEVGVRISEVIYHGPFFAYVIETQFVMIWKYNQHS